MQGIRRRRWLSRCRNGPSQCARSKRNHFLKRSSSSKCRKCKITAVHAGMYLNSKSKTFLLKVGWYHSHPEFPPDPSVTDIQNQHNYQVLFKDETSQVEVTLRHLGKIQTFLLIFSFFVHFPTLSRLSVSSFVLTTVGCKEISKCSVIMYLNAQPNSRAQYNSWSIPHLDRLWIGFTFRNVPVHPTT